MIHSEGNIVVTDGIPHPAGNFTGILQNGKIKDRFDKNPSIAVEHPSRVNLLPINSKEKRRTFPVPKRVFGRPIETEKPYELAKVSLDGLKEIITELKKML